MGGFCRGGQKERTRRARLRAIPAHRRAASWGIRAHVRCRAPVFWLRICPPPPSHLFFRLLLMHARRRRMARRNPGIARWLCNQWSHTCRIAVAARVKLLVIGCLVLCLLLLRVSDEFSALHDFVPPCDWRPRHSSPSSFSSLQCCADMGHASCWESTPSIIVLLQLPCRLQ